MTDVLHVQETAAGVPFVRSPDESFQGLTDYPWPPNYIDFEGLRLHYLDVGPKDGPVALLTHGMPTWSYLNRHIIARLSQAGWRCIAPDHIGFGRSDKVIDDGWYSIARHTRALGQLIAELDLTGITVFGQDWGGPTSLAHAAEHPERFARLVIMNTWMHHAAFDYTPAIREWNARWHEGGLFGANVPEPLSLGWLMTRATGRLKGADFFGIIEKAAYPELGAEADAVRRGYDAPHAGLGHAGHAGPRRFPLSLPFDNPEGGNADAQARHFAALETWTKPIHFIWGGADDVFTEAWGRAWAARFPQATFDPLPDAGHFLQDTHGDEIAEIFLRRIAETAR
ncbi:MAG: alpha/beta fold hydrolase [Caulobacteraceae bacterium]|nr:alpha/beta fold hydrolase [Caulobacteraceae bacterium]